MPPAAEKSLDWVREWWPIVLVALGTVYGYGQLSNRVEMLATMMTGNNILAVQLATATERIVALEKEIIQVRRTLDQHVAVQSGRP